MATAAAAAGAITVNNGAVGTDGKRSRRRKALEMAGKSAEDVDLIHEAAVLGGPPPNCPL